MAFVAARNLLNASRISINSKALFLNPMQKGLLRFDREITRTLSRSLFVLSKSRDSDCISNITTKKLLSNRCSCGCFLHTKGDKELAAFLAEEIENEKKAMPYPDLPKLDDFTCDLNGSEVTLTKKMEMETITIRSNVNNSVDAEDAVTDPNAPKEAQQEEMKSKPEFTVEIKKGGKILSFMCNYSHEMPDDISSQEYNDVFQIAEISLYEGELEDTTYTVSGDIMDGYLYDLLMNYLEERGISNEFAEKLVTFFTCYEHKLYVNLLKGMKFFVEK